MHQSMASRDIKICLCSKQRGTCVFFFSVLRRALTEIWYSHDGITSLLYIIESDNVSVELLLNAVRLSVRQYNNPNAAVYGEIFKVLFLLCGEEQAESLKNTSHFVVSYFLHTHSPHDVIALVRSLWENQKVMD